MRKKEATREQKFEEYRNSIENGDVEPKTPKKPEPKNSKKPTLKPLILEYKKSRRKRRFWYYFLVSLFAIIVVIVLIYFGVKIYG